MIAQTVISAQITVFDNTGKIVIQAAARIPSLTGYLALSPNDGEQYKQLYAAGALNILSTILALDPSSAISPSPDDYKEWDILLTTTEDEDEDKSE